MVSSSYYYVLSSDVCMYFVHCLLKARSRTGNQIDFFLHTQSTQQTDTHISYKWKCIIKTIEFPLFSSQQKLCLLALLVLQKRKQISLREYGFPCFCWLGKVEHVLESRLLPTITQTNIIIIIVSISSNDSLHNLWFLNKIILSENSLHFTPNFYCSCTKNPLIRYSYANKPKYKSLFHSSSITQNWNAQSNSQIDRSYINIVELSSNLRLPIIWRLY